MRTRRKTVGEKRAERDEVERRAVEAFLPQLASLRSLAEAHDLVSRPPRPGAPSRILYKNLEFFIDGSSFTVPTGSSDDERYLYARFIERLAEIGEVTRDQALEVVRRLEESIQNRYR